MSKIGAAWAAMSSAARAVAVGGLILPLVLVGAVVVAAVGMAPGPVVGPESSPSEDPIGRAPDRSPPAESSPSPSLPGAVRERPSPEPTPVGADPLLGTDGRLTVLLLGSDYRPAHPGNRTDAIMVVSVDPTTGKSAAFSVPRDVVDFPCPSAGRSAARSTACTSTCSRRRTAAPRT